MKTEFSLFKEGPIWHFRFRMDGRRIQRSTHETVYAKAFTVATEAFEAAKARARGDEPEPTLGQLVEQWTAAHTLALSPSRIDSMATFGRLHIASLRDLYLRDLTTRRVEEARAAYQATHARHSTNLWLNCLNTLVNWAIRIRMIRQKPWQVRKLKVKKKPKVQLPTRLAGNWMAEIDRLTPEDEGLALAVRLCLGMGLRVSEAIKARWEGLNWERKIYTPGDTKDGGADPRPVVDWLLAELQPFQTMGFILPSRPSHPITDKRVRYVMAKANRALCLPNVTPHRLRGTYATLLSLAGVPIQDIQKALGHTSILTTQGYLEADIERVRTGQVSLAEWLNLPGRKTGAPSPTDPHQTESGKFYREIPEVS